MLHSLQCLVLPTIAWRCLTLSAIACRCLNEKFKYNCLTLLGIACMEFFVVENCLALHSNDRHCLVLVLKKNSLQCLVLSNITWPCIVH